MILFCFIVKIVCFFNFLGLISFVVFFLINSLKVFLIFNLCLLCLLLFMFWNMFWSWLVIFFIFGGVMILIFGWVCVILILIFLLFNWFLCNFLWKDWWVEEFFLVFDLLKVLCVGGSRVFKMCFFVVFLVWCLNFLVCCLWVILIEIFIKLWMIVLIFLLI